jgi:hypothetical protein
VCRRRCGRTHRIDDDHVGAGVGKPVLLRVRCRRRWIRAPDHDGPRVACSAWIGADQTRPVDVAQRHLAGQIADRVGRDLSGAETLEET